MTAPINLMVDFLFVEVLSAPTIDSLKKESSKSSSIGRVLGQASKMARHASVVVSKNALSTLNRLGDMTSKSTKSTESTESNNWSELISTTRVIPPRTKEAHDEAVECANDVINNAKSRLEDRSRLTKSRHEAFLKFQKSHKSDQHRRRTEIPTKPSETRPSLLLNRLSTIFKPSSSFSSSSSSLKNNNNKKKVNGVSMMEMNTNSLFDQLSDDINQQRRLLKKSQQEVFDNLWG